MSKFITAFEITKPTTSLKSQTEECLDSQSASATRRMKRFSKDMSLDAKCSRMKARYPSCVKAYFFMRFSFPMNWARSSFLLSPKRLTIGLSTWKFPLGSRLKVLEMFFIVKVEQFWIQKKSFEYSF